MSRPAASIVARLCVVLSAGTALSACGSDAISSGDDPLAGLDEMAIHTAVSDHIGLFRHSAGASGNVRLALGPDGPPHAPLAPDLHGHTLRVDTLGQGWVAEADPAVAANAVRVIWYDTSQAAVTLPLSQRGHVDLVEEVGPALDRVRLRAVRTGNGAGDVADYLMGFGETTTAAARTARFDADGTVGDGSRQLQFDRQLETIEQLASGDATTVFQISTTAPGFTYLIDLEESVTASTQTSHVVLAASTAVDGVSTRLEIDVVEGDGQALTGTGRLHHAGRALADLAVTGSDWTFTRPDGGDFTANQRTRLGTLLAVLLNPLPVLESYFP